jgi:membrane carboxypeptidase/penicillin-binding protein
VHTTLDRRTQEIAEQELARQLRAIEGGEYGRFSGRRYARHPGGATEYLQGAVVLMDVHAGDVLALVGGRDFQQSTFDRAARAHRPPGSAFKPFVFAVALRKGYAPTQRIADTPLRMQLPGGEIWEPKNFDGRFEGQVTLREALVRSRNVPAVRLATAVGIAEVTRLARRAGIRSPLPNLPSLALGTADVTPLELTAAYTAFAGMGKAATPRRVKRVEDAEGNIVWQTDPETHDVLDPAVAYLLTHLLADAVTKGTGASVRHAGYTGPAAGKTGTTSGGADAWFVGYTPDMAGTIWIGFDNPKPIVPGATGGKLAAPVWGRIFRRATVNRAASHEWLAPEQINDAVVDASTGLVLETGCRPQRGPAVHELFIAGTEPASTCPRGTPPRKSGLLANVMEWGESQFTRGRRGLASLLGVDKAPRPARKEARRVKSTPAVRADEHPAVGEQAPVPGAGTSISPMPAANPSDPS